MRNSSRIEALFASPDDSNTPTTTVETLVDLPSDTPSQKLVEQIVEFEEENGLFPRSAASDIMEYLRTGGMITVVVEGDGVMGVGYLKEGKNALVFTRLTVGHDLSASPQTDRIARSQQFVDGLLEYLVPSLNETRRKVFAYAVNTDHLLINALETNKFRPVRVNSLQSLYGNQGTTPEIPDEIILLMREFTAEEIQYYSNR